MKDLLYVPGNFRCPQCRFHLVSNSINMKSGTISAQKADNRPFCLNCHEIRMEPLAWKTYAEELEKQMDEKIERHISGKMGVFLRACEAFRKRHPEYHNTSGYGCGCELCKAVEFLTGINPMADDEVLAHAEESSRYTPAFLKELKLKRGE